MTDKEIRDRWEAKARELIGFVVTNAKYMDDDNLDDWSCRPVELTLKKVNMGAKPSTVIIYPQADDEGNEGGALAVYKVEEEKGDILPVLWR